MLCKAGYLAIAPGPLAGEPLENTSCCIVLSSLVLELLFCWLSSDDMILRLRERREMGTLGKV
jgi:hypothetical protein